MKKTNEVSKMVGVSKRTLQYYDDEGLIKVERSKDNHRLYDEDALEKIWQILVYKEMGFALREIKDLLILPERQKISILEKRMEMIENQIAEMNGKKAFISFIRGNGMPKVDMEGKTYVECVAKLREKMGSL